MMNLIFIWQVMYYLLPGWFANTAPIFAKRINIFNGPVDFGKRLISGRIFGDNKTWRGIFAALVVGVLVFQVQILIGHNSLIDYSQYVGYSGVLYGLLFGAGAMVGDLIGSFLKRRFRIRSGKSWIPVDQLDLAFGIMLLTWPMFSYTWEHVLIILILTFISTVVCNGISFRCGLHGAKI